MQLKKILFSILPIILMVGGVQEAKSQKLYTTPVTNLKQLQQYFRYKKGMPTLISGHRGGMMPGYPENCIESCEKTLSLMPSFFEIDPRLTKDSVIVLMHDETIDRTTNGTGKVAELTYAELKKYRLKDRNKKMTDYKIPTLMEMLEWGKDKTIFNLDNKHVPWQIYSKLLKESGFANIMLSVRSLEEALFYFKRNDNIMFCVAIQNMEDYNAYKKSGIPWNRIMAFVGYTMDPQHEKVYALLRKKGVMCMVTVGPTVDRLKTNEERRTGYLLELSKKPDIIETDYPSLFIGLNSTENKIEN